MIPSGSRLSITRVLRPGRCLLVGLVAALPLAGRAADAGGPGPTSAAVATPDARSMIEALRPAAARSLRNLVVRPTADAAASEPAAATPNAAASGSAPGAGSAAAAPPGLSLAIPFELNSAHVRPDSSAMLANLVAAMQSPELRGSRFVIEGHTDARGSAAANLQLSQERADEVRLYLVALGVRPGRLRAVGKGSSEPANPRDPLAPENRRVRVLNVE
jgi:outer membrane protein OmpA-like peptidoglycan-associated protein